MANRAAGLSENESISHTRLPLFVVFKSKSRIHPVLIAKFGVQNDSKLLKVEHHFRVMIRISDSHLLNLTATASGSASFASLIVHYGFCRRHWSLLRILLQIVKFPLVSFALRH